MRWFGKRKEQTTAARVYDEVPVETLSPEETVVRTPMAMLAEMPTASVDDWMAHVGGAESVVVKAPEPIHIVAPVGARDPKAAPDSTLDGLSDSLTPEEWALQSLTPREREVFNLLMEGKTLKQISECLGVKFSTINTHYKSVYRKLNVNSRAEFILRYCLVSRDS